MPPVSKVTALPTRPSARARRRRSAARSGAAPRASPARPPGGRPSRSSAIRPGRAPRPRARRSRPRGRARARRASAGVSVVGGKVLEVARRVLALDHDARRRRRACPMSSSDTISSSLGPTRRGSGRRRSCNGRTGMRRAACPRSSALRDRGLRRRPSPGRPRRCASRRASRARAERDRRGDPRTLGVELVALAEADGHHARGADRAVRMQHRRLLERALRLARLDQPAEPAAERVVDRRRRALVLEQADAERVGVVRRGCPGGRRRASSCASIAVRLAALAMHSGPRALAPQSRPNRGSTTMPQTVILGAARTPFGKLGGALRASTPPTWAARRSPRRSSAPRSSPSRWRRS